MEPYLFDDLINSLINKFREEFEVEIKKIFVSKSKDIFNKFYKEITPLVKTSDTYEKIKNIHLNYINKKIIEIVYK